MGNADRNTYVMRRITDATLSLIAEKGLRETTITEIVDTAQVSRNSFYRNFSDKEDVLRRHVRSITDEWLSATDVSFRDEPLDAYLVKLLSHMLEHRALSELLLRENLMHLVRDEFDRVFDERYEGVYDAFRARFFAGGIYSIFLMWLERGCKETPGELASSLANMLDKEG